MRAAHERKVVARQLTEVWIALHIGRFLEEGGDGHKVDAEATGEVREGGKAPFAAPEGEGFATDILVANYIAQQMGCTLDDRTFDVVVYEYTVMRPAGYCRFYKQGARFLKIDQPLAKFRIGGTTNDSIYKKKEDYRLFVESYGGSSWDFHWIWLKAVVKYSLIQTGYRLFGSNLKFKIQHNRILKHLIPL